MCNDENDKAFYSIGYLWSVQLLRLNIRGGSGSSGGGCGCSGNV